MKLKAEWMDDFSKVESVDYPNISKIETSEIGELGFLDIYDKTGEKISFTFESEKLKEIIDICNVRFTWLLGCICLDTMEEHYV